ncbi:NAD(P)H-dependent oxidoreductase [Paludibacter sp. 221]|uniref:nitroreductase family protein n=1 Tax=Paludibacter sp. 221 TaxID=2302939 RepID=UPI0013D57BE5|nr:nitroreductase family protein [Paludibacter sp. 221]NDV47038.1 NAD(P)H-dependent oxidoreductase [Paludibacter sp. 221]
MNLIEKMNWRYAAKRMNGEKVPQEKIDRILEAIRLSPSSGGLQPYRIFVIGDKDLRERIYNERACHQYPVIEGSHILVFTAYKKVNQQLVDDFISLVAETREQSFESLSGLRNSFNKYIEASAEENFLWTTHQAYLAFGIGIAAAALEGVDATPMEGLDPDIMSEILHLDEQNLRATTVLALGYRDADKDKYAHLPKVRKSKDKLFETFD